jgi:serine/threonine-protein kinase
MAHVDRDLLFGLLALQNGLIDQVQLVAAFQAWTLNKARGLAEHLISLGHLSDAQRAVVAAMADLHVAKHGDVERSLGAVTAGRSIRARLTGVGDADIDASILRLGAVSTQAGDGDLDLTSSYSVGTATSEGQRFRILRPHARGGLGEVFVALDSELHREVALKQILDQHADDPNSRQRFVIEAEITGGLEHPGVVPVYGLGTDGCGRPYYAMRFIRGDSLKEAIARFHGDTVLNADPGRRSLELRKLLHRFLDACNAIDYAHSRGVLHRDIKPANVIVGKHGETLVVDWGVAKALGRSEPGSDERPLVPGSAGASAETLPGITLGTPAYMSPEQAKGDLDRLGPRSDVCSLGATLYCLLTGQPPFAGETAEVLRAVQRGEFLPPRQLDASIDPALEAVCRKAMALKPDDRYPSPKALGEDIERWMADEPVSAWREPFSRRARRWARRNRTAVATAAAAVLMALAGTASVLAVQTRANRELRAANKQTLQERDLARRNFDLAQQNFVLARKAVDDYLTRIGQNPLLKEQGLHDLRRELFEDALRYYRNFLLQRGDDPSLTADAAAAHERVGDILIDLGRIPDALAAYDQALALVERLVREQPGDATTRTARVRLEAGRLQALRDVADRYPDAITIFDRVRKIGEDLLVSGGGTEDLPEILARAYDSAAFVLRHTNRTDEALRAVLRAHELAERAARDRPGDPSTAYTLLVVSSQAAYLLRFTGGVEDARRLCEQDIAFGKAQVREHPRDVEMRMHLARLELNFAVVENLRGRQIEALTIHRRVADALGVLARENAMLIRARTNWAMALVPLSQLQTDLGQCSEAQQSARAAIELFEALAREVPSGVRYRLNAGLCYAALGKALLKDGRGGEALPTLRKALEILEASDDVGDVYDLACSFALASTIADPAERPAGAARQRRDADHAVAAIRRAILMGFANARKLKTDPDLDSLRVRPDFQALLMDSAFPANPFAR